MEALRDFLLMTHLSADKVPSHFLSGNICFQEKNRSYWKDMPPDHIASCMSEPAEVQACLLEFVRNGVFSAGIQVTEETDLVANGFDSLSLVSLLVFIEKTSRAVDSAE